MKKLILTLIFVSFVTCGCVNIDTTLNLGFDKYKASITSTLKYDGDLSDYTDPGTKGIFKYYRDFADDETLIDIDRKNSTVVYTKNAKNVKNRDLDLRTFGFVSNLPSGKFIEVKKNFFVKSYYIDMSYNLPEIVENLKEKNIESVKEETKPALKPEYLNQYGDNFVVESTEDNTRDDLALNFENHFNYSSNVAADKISPDKDEIKKAKELTPNLIDADFNIKVPAFASFNNADEMNGFTYTWHIRKNAPTVIRFQYVVYRGFGITFVLLLAIAGLIYYARRLSKKENLKRIDSDK